MTYVGMVPTVAVDLARRALAVGVDLSSLLALVLGGSTPCLDLIRMLESDLGVPVFQGWGMTGISPMGTTWGPSRPPASTDDDPPARHAFIRTRSSALGAGCCRAWSGGWSTRISATCRTTAGTQGSC